MENKMEIKDIIKRLQESGGKAIRVGFVGTYEVECLEELGYYVWYVEIADGHETYVDTKPKPKHKLTSQEN